MTKLTSIMSAYDTKKILSGTTERMRDSLKVNVFCAISEINFHGPFSFDGKVIGDVHREISQNRFFDELIANGNEQFIFQQDGNLPHTSLETQCAAYLNYGCAGDEENVLLILLPPPPDLEPNDFMLLLFEKTSICLTLLGTNHQARNQLGTPGGAKSFPRGAQIF